MATYAGIFVEQLHVQVAEQPIVHGNVAPCLSGNKPAVAFCSKPAVLSLQDAGKRWADCFAAEVRRNSAAHQVQEDEECF